MEHNRRILAYVLYILLGATLWVLGAAEIVDAFWSGMGAALFIIGALRLIQIYRFRKDADYRERKKVELTDERNRFICNKAWAWAGYLFILCMGVAVIILKVMGEELLSMAASLAVCFMVILYWVSYLVLRKKY